VGNIFTFTRISFTVSVCVSTFFVECSTRTLPFHPCLMGTGAILL
jgi:hypothetical protein